MNYTRHYFALILLALSAPANASQVLASSSTSEYSVHEIDFDAIETLKAQIRKLLQDITIKTSAHPSDARCATITLACNKINEKFSAPTTRAHNSLEQELTGALEAINGISIACDVTPIALPATRKSVSEAELVTIYASLQSQIDKIKETIAQLKVSRLSQLLKTTVETAQAWHIDTIAKRSLPYVGLGVWWIHITKIDDIKKYNNSFLTWLKENVIGGTEKKIPAFSYSTSALPEADSDGRIPKNKLDIWAEMNANAAHALRERKDIKLTTDIATDRSSLFGKVLDVAGNILESDLKSNLFKIGIPVLVFPYIKKDAEDLYKIATTKTAEIYHWLVDEPATVAQPELTNLKGKPLSEKDRRAFIKTALRNCCYPVSFPELVELTNSTYGCSEKQLASIFADALSYAEEQNRALTSDDIQKAIDKHVYHIDINAKIGASHEVRMHLVELAGTALVYELLQPCYQLTRITLLPLTQANTESKYFAPQGFFIQKNQLTQVVNEFEEMKKLCIIATAGAAAQQFIFGSASIATLEEAQQRAFNIARTLILRGVKEETLPRTIVEEQLQQAWVLVQEQAQQALELIMKNQDALNEIIEQLKEKLSLTGAEIAAIVVK